MNLKFKAIVFLFVLQLSVCFAYAKAEKKLDSNYKTKYSHDQTSCLFRGKKFELHLGDNQKIADSESKGFGYSHFWIQRSGKKIISAIPPMEFNEIRFLRPTSTSLCAGTVAYDNSTKNLAIFFRQNNRPFPDVLGALFLDPTRPKVLAFKRNLGISEVVEQTDKGMFFLTNDSPTDAGAYEVNFRGVMTLPKEAQFQAWYQVQLLKGGIEVSFDRVLNWDRSPYRDYFKNRDKFEKAIGYNATTKKINAKWVFTIPNPDCIQVTEVRKPHEADGDWYCK